MPLCCSNNADREAVTNFGANFVVSAVLIAAVASWALGVTCDRDLHKATSSASNTFMLIMNMLKDRIDRKIPWLFFRYAHDAGAWLGLRCGVF